MRVAHAHPDTPFCSSGSYGGWRSCRECARRGIRGEYVSYEIRRQVMDWHERVWSDMFEDYYGFKQEQPNADNPVSADTGSKV